MTLKRMDNVGIVVDERGRRAQRGVRERGAQVSGSVAFRSDRPHPALSRKWERGPAAAR